MKDPGDKSSNGNGHKGPDPLPNKNTKYHLRLYITATTPSSARAVANIRKLCEKYLPGRFELEVIDITTHPEIAKREQLIGAPTLIKHLPLPLRRFIGDMSNTEKLIVGLNLKEA
jgi:circadian clock protein KaiB